MKKYIALLTALSILAANGTTAVSAVSETSDGNSETVSVSESEKKECLISILLVGNYLSDFIKSYQKTLEEEGVPADEVLQIHSVIYAQLSENGRLTDDELEAKRLEFISEETNKDIDSFLSQIGIDRKETEITDVSGWYEENKFNIKDIALHRAVIRASFSMRRKTLSNCLKSNFGFSASQLDNIFSACNFDKNIRGEALTTADFVKLSNTIYQLKQSTKN